MTKKVETVEEFLKRGGQIKRFDPKPDEEQVHFIKLNQSNPHLMSLTDGQFFFAEKQERAAVDQKKKFLDKLDKAKLPQELIDKLKKAVNKDAN